VGSGGGGVGGAVAARDDDGAVRWLRAALRPADDGGDNGGGSSLQSTKQKKNKHHKAKARTLLLAAGPGRPTGGDDGSVASLESSLGSTSSGGMFGNGPAQTASLSLGALGYGGEGEGFTGGVLALEALTNLGECHYHGEVRRGLGRGAGGEGLHKRSRGQIHQYVQIRGSLETPLCCPFIFSFFSHRQGVRRNRPEAARLYRLAAVRGHAAAQARRSGLGRWTPPGTV
jgi:TPR repeat protein